MRFKNTFITLEQELFNHLEQTICKHNLHYAEDDDNKIMMDKAVFMIDYILHQKSLRKDDVTAKGFIRIPSKYLNIFLQKELRKYKDFLVRYGYIKTIPYSKEESKSFGYLVSFFDNKSCLNSDMKEYSVYKFLSLTYEKHLSKSLEQYTKIEHKKRIADRSTRHLTKWINEDSIQVDWEAAFRLIDISTTLISDQKEQYSYSFE